MNLNEGNKSDQSHTIQEIKTAEDLISVIVPVYNGEKYLPQFLESLSTQTYNNFEIIFGYDQKSTDNSLEILQNFRNKISDKHKVIIDEGIDKGPGGGRNRGLFLARGDYVTFVDDDDYLMPQYLEYLHEAFILHPELNVSCCRCIQSWFGEDINAVCKEADVASEHVIYVYDKKEMLSSFLHRTPLCYSPNKIITSPAGWIYMVNREHLLTQNLVFFDWDIIEDVIWSLRLLCSTDKCAYTSKIMYVYCLHEDSNFNSSKPMQFMEKINKTCRLISEDVDPVIPQFSQNLRYQFLLLFLTRSVFSTDYESWKKIIAEQMNITAKEKELDKALEKVKIIPANPDSEIDNLVVDVFNKNKHWCYVLIKYYWHTVLSKRWRLRPFTTTVAALTDENEKQIAYELEKMYPQYLKE